METQFPISTGSSDTTQSNGNSSLSILNQMEIKLTRISRYYSTYLLCCAGGGAFTKPRWTLTFAGWIEGRKTTTLGVPCNRPIEAPQLIRQASTWPNGLANGETWGNPYNPLTGCLASHKRGQAPLPAARMWSMFWIKKNRKQQLIYESQGLVSRHGFLDTSHTSGRQKHHHPRLPPTASPTSTWRKRPAWLQVGIA